MAEATSIVDADPDLADFPDASDVERARREARARPAAVPGLVGADPLGLRGRRMGLGNRLIRLVP